MQRQKGTEPLPTTYTQLAALLTLSQMSGARELWIQVFTRLEAPASAKQHETKREGSAAGTGGAGGTVWPGEALLGPISHLQGLPGGSC